uniref:Beta expansin EXPB2.1 n=1 Tax=Mirabilis jalapa TaxID=3538 RepID=Q84L48_MIRJA|nr:beta expansin EXPB2.1 [Mirabilis jalapa]
MDFLVHLIFFFFMLLSSPSAAAVTVTACDQCFRSKAAFFATSTSLSGGACGYGALAQTMYGGHFAAAGPSIFRSGLGCGACFQIRCKRIDLCSKAGTTIVVTDLHPDTKNASDFVLSNRAFRSMAWPGKDVQVLQLGIADVEYKRVPCIYRGQNLTFRVEEYSKFPYYLAIKILYQGGQTDILQADVGSVGQVNSWKPMKHNYGAIWDASVTPKGPLQFRFKVQSGNRVQYLYTNQVLPEYWKPGATYTSSVQISNVAAHGCSPCGSW